MARGIRCETRDCKHCGVPFLGYTRSIYCNDCIPQRKPGESNRWYMILSVHGVDKQMWDAMYFDQDGECAICVEREAKVVDHDHATGKVRGLLCDWCNKGIGMLLDRVDVISRAAAYLEESK